MNTNVFAQEDPYLWLEDVMGEKAISWVKEQNAKSQKLLEAEPQFAAIRDGVATPEDINERPEYAPSTRIKSLFPAYKKTLHGPTAAARIGLDRIRAECPHFNAWMDRIERFAAV